MLILFWRFLCVLIYDWWSMRMRGVRSREQVGGFGWCWSFLLHHDFHPIQDLRGTFCQCWEHERRVLEFDGPPIDDLTLAYLILINLARGSLPLSWSQVPFLKRFFQFAVPSPMLSFGSLSVPRWGVSRFSLPNVFPQRNDLRTPKAKRLLSAGQQDRFLRS